MTRKIKLRLDEVRGFVDVACKCDFDIDISYRLDDNGIFSEITVKNTGEEILPFAPGAHPGFCVPIGGKGVFSDYYIEFEEGVNPDHMLFTSTCYQTGLA